MERNTFFCNLGLYIKSVLVFILLLSGSGSAWADTVIFNGSVDSAWEYKNSLGTNVSVTNDQLFDSGGYGTPKTYTSKGTFSISSGERIKITAKRSSSLGTNLPSIKVKYYSDDKWNEVTEFTQVQINSTTDYVDVFVDDSKLVGSYKIQFELQNVYISSIILKSVPTTPLLKTTHPASGDAFGYVTVNTSKTYTIENDGIGAMNVNITSSNSAFTLSTSELTDITNDGTGKTFDVIFNYDSEHPEPHSAVITITPTYDGAIAESFTVSAGPEVEVNEDKSTTWTTGSGKNVYVKYTAKNGWNTICMPISVNAYKTSLFGSGATTKAYVLSNYDSATGTITFETTNYLGAGTPYLVYVENAASAPFLINNISVNYGPTGALQVQKPSSGTSKATFKGTFAPIEKGYFPANSYGITTTGKIVNAGENSSIKGYRAYFLGGLAAGARMLVIDDDETTDLGLVKMVSPEVKDVFNLNGQRVKKGRKGLYVVNGKKVVIK